MSLCGDGRGNHPRLRITDLEIESRCLGRKTKQLAKDQMCLTLSVHIFCFLTAASPLKAIKLSFFFQGKFCLYVEALKIEEYYQTILKQPFWFLWTEIIEI